MANMIDVRLADIAILLSGTVWLDSWNAEFRARTKNSLTNHDHVPP
jgi:hypothetical protein